jgi:hypothetical protein
MGVPGMTEGMQGGNRLYAGSFWHQVREKSELWVDKSKLDFTNFNGVTPPISRLIMSLDIKKHQLIEFYQRWRSKSRDYKGDNLVDYFDKFFTLYVIFNRIYSVSIAVLHETGQLNELVELGKIEKLKKNRLVDEHVAATTCIAYFLKEDLAAVLTENKSEIEEFDLLIDQHIFNIDLFYGKPQREKDLELLDGLRSKNEFTKVVSLLRILYNIRCNVFHAEKGYNNEQKFVLGPCNNVLERLVDRLIKRLESV